MLLAGLLMPHLAQANPQGLSVQSGSASAAVNGSQLNVTASANAVLNWQGFNIAPGETTVFQQPSASSVVWNQIHDANPSQIWGHLDANGVVVLMNPAGFYFGPHSVVNAAGLVVSTAPGAPIESGDGLFWQFNGAPPQASIVNYGQLNAGRGGSLFLIAEHVENHGTLSAPEGSIGLVAGKEVLLSSRPDGRGLTASVRLPSGSVDNQGQLVADAGAIAMNARVVNQNGLVQANSVRERNGIIELVASDAVNLGNHSTLSARGGPVGHSDGGDVKIQSGGSFADAPGSHIGVAGGETGGNGGSAEVSAPSLAAIHSTIDGQAHAGGIGGRLVIDPTDIEIGYSGAGSAGAGTVNAGDAPAKLTLDVNSAFVGFSQIDLQATHNINLAAGVTWDLAASTGIAAPGSSLKLEAGNNISIANGAGIVAGQGWSVTLQAGRDFAVSDRVTPGVGNIALAGTSSIETRDGDIQLVAGNNVTVAGGFARTVGGGNITVQAVAGSINTGTKANGFVFRPTGYAVDPDLGGISTANGGNVSLTAGQDIQSYLPLPGGVQTDGGSGAFGAAPGNVTVVAGRDVAGHFVVRNGSGRISAGRDAGTTTKLLALSLVSGGWTVHAARDILLQEVRNPNGIFNNLGFGSAATKHYFDYAADAYTILGAGNSVQLRGTALPRYDDTFEQSITPIYPGRLEITAGAGGVSLGNDVTLFPAPTGNLKITTTDGGSLVGTVAGDLTSLVVSDSGKTQYRAAGDFGVADHAATPVHLNDTEPVSLNIAGNMRGILLAIPKRAEVKVGGNLINSRFDGQNLRADDVTRIQVAGDIINRNEFTSVTVNTAPDLSLFDLIYPALNGGLAGLPSQFFYDPATHQVTFQGRMTGDQLQLLSNLPVQVFGANGLPVLNANGEPVTHLVSFIDRTALLQLYTDSQDVPLNPDTGYRLGGGGLFDLTARNLDLGATVGIVSQGPRANPALAQYFTRGADIHVTLSGNLDMFSTTISSLNGGDIQVVAGGNVNAGSRTFTGNDTTARGIFTTDLSDVSVIAGGDIHVNGSRIAAYDGGNVTVRSLEGSVDAGTGGGGAVTVEKIVVDPLTRAILTYSPTIPGSGVLATTFPPSLDPAFPTSENPVGNILVETPRGNIIASAGGVVQIPLNGSASQAGTVTLRAGTTGPDGTVVYPGNIDATGSGVIGSQVKLEASGKITGLVFARENIDLTAQQSVNVTALAQGSVSVNAGGNISGTIIGVGSVSASGSTVDAALLSQNVSASGNVAASQVGFAQGAAATGTSQSLQSDEPTKALAAAKTTNEEDLLKKKKTTGPRLAKTVGKVTVILPEK